MGFIINRYYSSQEFSRPFLAPKYTENMEQQQIKFIDIKETSELYNEEIFFY